MTLPTNSYDQEYAASVNAPIDFWFDKAAALPWFKNPTPTMTHDQNGQQLWFADAELNTCYMAIDYHVEQGRGEQIAVIYDSPVTGQKQQYTYAQMQEWVAKFASVLASQGVGKGDRVVIYMPMIVEAVVAMLASARLGAVHSVVFGGFAANELAVRIDDAKPKALITASCGIEISKVIEYKPMVDKAIAMSKHAPSSVVLLQRPECQASMIEGRDVDWHAAIAEAETSECVPVKGSDPLYILYTSGTTGKPKGVVRDNAGHAVALHYSMTAVYDMQPGEVFWAASDVGWVVGHSYIVYAPLLFGCTTVVYEGKPVRTPDAGAFWRVIEEYDVKSVFAAPTAFRAIRKEDPNGELIKKYDLSCLKTIFMAGERLDPPTLEWTQEKTGKPVIDHWWQTETGWAIAANLTGIEILPTKPGSATKPVPGFDVQILDDNGESVGANQQGAIAIKLPLPPSCLNTIWGDHQRYEDGYLTQFPGYYCTGDGGYIDDDGYLFVMGRTDDVINVAGHRLSTGEMEEVLAAHTAVAECSVIGIPDQLKGQVPVGLAVLKNGIEIQQADLEKELVSMIRRDIGAVACLKQTLIVPRLPKTRSGKILRKLLRQIAQAQPYSIPSTIDDPASVDELAGIMRENGVITATSMD